MPLLQERDGFKKILESYENEATVNIGQVTNSRVRQLEEIVEGYHQQVATLEENIAEKSEKLSEVTARAQLVKIRSSSKIS